MTDGGSPIVVTTVTVFYKILEIPYGCLLFFKVPFISVLTLISITSAIFDQTKTDSFTKNSSGTISTWQLHPISQGCKLMGCY